MRSACWRIRFDGNMYRTQGRSFPVNIEQFALNCLVMNADMADWNAGVRCALEILAS